MAQELWQIAKPFGRPRKFKTAQELWDAFIAYVEWSANNPMTISDSRLQRNKYNSKSELPNLKQQYKQTVERPLSLGSFRLHAGIHRQWGDFRKDYMKRSNAFCEVIYAIEEQVREQQIANAAGGNYKENLVSRLNGLAEVTKQEVKADVQARTSLSVGEAQAFLEELDKTI